MKGGTEALTTRHRTSQRNSLHNINSRGSGTCVACGQFDNIFKVRVFLVKCWKGRAEHVMSQTA